MGFIFFCTCQIHVNLIHITRFDKWFLYKKKPTKFITNYSTYFITDLLSQYTRSLYLHGRACTYLHFTVLLHV